MNIENDSAVRTLRAILGEKWVRTDDATLSTYSWNHGVGAQPGPRFPKQWPLAVVLPESTEEVAAIVKLCVAEGLSYRAHSTGTGAFYVTKSARSVVIDLCRMNRIVKIDASNQYAVIEPYVTAGRLQAEAMKLGLNCHIIGAGPGHSPLASATSFLGVGVTGASTGMNGRNMLAIEWVSPEGEIVRIGTDGEDWFSEEGPGPGIRGMIRGYMGAHGALGVFTRIGYKLFPWHGSERQQVTGRHPQLGVKPEKHMRFFMASWESAEAMRDASFRLNRSGIAMALLRMPPSGVGWTLCATNTEYARRRVNGQLPEYADPDVRYVWQIVTHGRNAEHATFQERVLRNILDSTGGRFLDVDPDHAEVLLRGILNSTYVGRVSRASMAGATAFGVSESFNCFPDVFRGAELIIKGENGPGGTMASDTKDGHWTWTTEGRQLWTESLITANPADGRGAASALVAFLHTFNLTNHSPRYGNNAFMAGVLVELFGQPLQRVNVWMRRIKNAFDPTWAADPAYFLPRKRVLGMKIFALLEPVLFSAVGRAFLRSQVRVAYRKFSVPQRRPSSGIPGKGEKR